MTTGFSPSWVGAEVGWGCSLERPLLSVRELGASLAPQGLSHRLEPSLAPQGLSHRTWVRDFRITLCSQTSGGFPTTVVSRPDSPQSGPVCCCNLTNPRQPRSDDPHCPRNPLVPFLPQEPISTLPPHLHPLLSSPLSQIPSTPKVHHGACPDR